MERKIVDNYKHSNLLIIKERCIIAEQKIENRYSFGTNWS